MKLVITAALALAPLLMRSQSGYGTLGNAPSGGAHVDLSEGKLMEMKRDYERHPRADKAIAISDRYEFRELRSDSAIAILQREAARRKAPRRLNIRLLSLLFEAGRYEEAKFALKIIQASGESVAPYQRIVTLLAMVDGEDVDYAVPEAGLSAAEVFKFRSIEATHRGDLVGELAYGEMAMYHIFCGVDVNMTAVAKTLHATYQELLRLSLAGEPWPIKPYPTGSYEAAYAKTLEAAFAQVAADREHYGPYYEMIFRAVSQTQRQLAESGLTDPRVQFAVGLSRLHDNGAYELYFYYALNGYTDRQSWYVDYLKVNDGKQAENWDSFRKAGMCTLIEGLRE